MVPTSFINQACEILAETNKGLSGPKIVEHLNSYAFDYGVDISFSEYPFPKSVPNKRTALRKNLQAFTPEQQLHILNDLCQLDLLRDNETVRNLRYQLVSRYGHLLTHPESSSIDAGLIEQAKHWLSDFPAALKLYEEALLKYENKIFLRNLLDDLRLCLEKLLHAILKNSKSLENQIQDLGGFVKERGGSKELSNQQFPLGRVRSIHPVA